MRLSRDFYKQSTVLVAKELLGKLLVIKNNEKLSGKIIETEAYLGVEDKACHSSKGKTIRTAIMFGAPGYTYVYLCYGIHCMFNVVTREEGFAEAVLIRALEPIQGIESMRRRCNYKRTLPTLTNGPGKWTQAFGITLKDNGCDLLSEKIYITEYSTIDSSQICASPRIGIHYAQEWKDKLLRFSIDNHSNTHSIK